MTRIEFSFRDAPGVFQIPYFMLMRIEYEGDEVVYGEVLLSVDEPKDMPLAFKEGVKQIYSPWRGIEMDFA